MRIFPGGMGGVQATDEQLMLDLAAGREEAIGPLYSRYAPLVFGMAAQTLDRATAEEIVQDVFLAVWRRASSFDPERGAPRPWLLQIAHHRIASELRLRRRRPRTEPDPDGERLARLADPAPSQAEETWREHRREILRRALEELPPAQRQALGLAYFEELSQGEIASVLGLPLGTAKSRIRAGLAGLRGKLAPLAAALIVAGLLAGLVVRLHEGRNWLEQDERALAMLTSSDAVSLRLAPAPGFPAETHARYRFRPGSPIAVITFSSFPAAGEGQSDRAWAFVGGRWLLLGEAVPDASGHARLIAEGPALAAAPERLVVTRERGPVRGAPSGETVVRWTSDRK
jgi:RNA polymerase sigma-70 factor (ECF subfamily)